MDGSGGTRLMDIVLVIGLVVALLALIQYGFVAAIGEWVQQMMARGLPIP